MVHAPAASSFVCVVTGTTSDRSARKTKKVVDAAVVNPLYFNKSRHANKIKQVFRGGLAAKGATDQSGVCWRQPLAHLTCATSASSIRDWYGASYAEVRNGRLSQLLGDHTGQAVLSVQLL